MFLKKVFILSVFCLFIHNSWGQEFTVRQVVDRILGSLETQIHPGSVDTLKAGSWDQKVTGIATTFMATYDVLKRAQEEGANLIITHEPTFYNHLDQKDYYGIDDPLVTEKLAFIEANNLVVFRFHDVPHQIKDDMIFKGLIQKLGWNENHMGNMVFTSPYVNVGELALFLKERFNTTTIRVVGDPEMEIKKIGILPGAYGSQGQVQNFKDKDIDVMIVGESREWETIEYVRDALEAGWNRTLIVMGHADSEEPGMEYTAEWLKGIFPGMKVEFIPAGNPLWTPE